jgi:hypothetical protein
MCKEEEIRNAHRNLLETSRYHFGDQVNGMIILN